MEKDCKQTGPTSTERRRFLKLSAGFGVTAAMVALSKGALGSEEASAQVVRKEAELRVAASHTMILGTAYAPGVSRSYPIMQLDFKENIQNASLDKIYVKLASAGQVGTSGALARKVLKATIHLAIWNYVKQNLAGSLSKFDEFKEAADTIGNYYISEK